MNIFHKWHNYLKSYVKRWLWTKWTYEKCQFARRPEIQFVAYVVSERGISVLDYGVRTLKEFLNPQNDKELEIILEIFVFVHRFVRNASGLSANLHSLWFMKNKKDFICAWAKDQQEDFQNCKHAIQNATLLSHTQADTKTEIWSDARAQR